MCLLLWASCLHAPDAACDIAGVKMRYNADGTNSRDRARHAADQRNSVASKQLTEVRIAKDAKVEKKSKKISDKKKLNEAKVSQLRPCRLDGQFGEQQEQTKLITLVPCPCCCCLVQHAEKGQDSAGSART
jgi:hypothetical protein